jgi:hyaluronoglucosaminidase
MAPWSSADRPAHVDFLGSLKANTYVYSPKDDPYARDRWRDPYPAERLAELGTLIEEARRRHVRFTYAISPGPSICFSSPADVAALRRKIDALRALGVRSFYIAFDDINYRSGTAPATRPLSAPSGAAAAGIAQSKLLNTDRPTHHRDPARVRADDRADRILRRRGKPYKAALRAGRIRASSCNGPAPMSCRPPLPSAMPRPPPRPSGARRCFGTITRSTIIRLDRAAADGALCKREAVSSELTGILANPMNQEAPSRVAVTGSAGLRLERPGYDPDRTALCRARSGGQ